MAEARPVIGVVIPVFGHTRLVAEAIESLAAQDFAGTLLPVVVIDGDRRPELLEIVEAMRTRLPRLAAIFRANGRLPAARNTGIAYLLAAAPELDAIYFLDADNRLTSEAIGRFWDALEAHPEAGWVYPDIGFFGLCWSQTGVDARITAPRYSRFRHLMGNICEAGSMVRGSVFRGGLRYDESFNTGYEDWEFWLQCIAAGYSGVGLEQSGFHYRRRADSMLAEADRQSDEIKQRIHQKHAALFAPSARLDLFDAECASFIALDVGGEITLLSADGTVRERGDSALRGLVDEARMWFYFAYLPEFVLVPLPGAAVFRPVRMRIVELVAMTGVATMAVDERLVAVAQGSPDQAGWLIPRTILSQLTERDVADTPYTAGLSQPVRAGLLRMAEILRSVVLPAMEPHGRYAGPASFRIGAFLAGLDDPAVLPEDAPPPATRSGLAVIDPLDRLSRSWLKAQALAQLPAAGVTLTAMRDLPSVQYMGHMFPYEPPRSDRTDTGNFAALLVVEDWPLLPFARSVFVGAGQSLYYLCSEDADGDEIAAIQCGEHAIAGIVCRPEAQTLFRSIGIPGHKILGEAEFLQRVAQ
jgi:glycosyltransferase involved in cell wall biosynthesis